MKTLKTWIINKLTERRARNVARSEFLAKLDARIAELNAKPMSTRRHYVAPNGNRHYVTTKAVRIH